MAIVSTQDGSEIVIGTGSQGIVFAVRAPHAPTAPAVLLTVSEAEELRQALSTIIGLQKATGKARVHG
jgi:hypothetical protein